MIKRVRVPKYIAHIDRIMNLYIATAFVTSDREDARFYKAHIIHVTYQLEGI